MNRNINFLSLKSHLQLFDKNTFVPNPLGFRNLVEGNIRPAIAGRLDNHPLHL